MEKAHSKDSTAASVKKGSVPNNHPEQVDGMLTVGTPVGIKKTVLTGTIAGYHLSDDNKTLSYLVDYEEDGVPHQRGFTSLELEKKEATNA